MSVQAVVQSGQPGQGAGRPGAEAGPRRGLKVFTHRANPAKLRAGPGSTAGADGDDEVVISRLGKRMLGRVEERNLLRAWREQGDARALARLIEAYQPLIPPLARKYANYGLGIADLLQEGNCGLMVAVSKFDLDRDVRFATYAAWWVHSAISDYVLANWSLVRIGSSANQRKLFFQLRSLARKSLVMGENLTIEEQIQQVAEETGVSAAQVRSTYARMNAGEISLNVPDPETGAEAIELIEDPSQSTDQVDENLDLRRERELLRLALEKLDPRERQIVEARYLGDEERSLRDIGRALSLTHERIRQLQLHALAKLKALLTSERESLKAELHRRRTDGATATLLPVPVPATVPAQVKATRPARPQGKAVPRRSRRVASRYRPTAAMVAWSATSSLVPASSIDHLMAVRQCVVASRHSHLVRAMVVAVVVRQMVGRGVETGWHLDASSAAVARPAEPVARWLDPVDEALAPLQFGSAPPVILLPCGDAPSHDQDDAVPELFPMVAAGYGRCSRLRLPDGRAVGWG